MIYQISVESASLRIQMVVNNLGNYQDSAQRRGNHDGRNERLSKTYSKQMRKETDRLSLSSSNKWNKCFSLCSTYKNMHFRILSLCLLGLLIIPNIVDCDTIEYPTEPYIYMREEPEQSWKKKTSQFIEMYELKKMISRRISSVTSAQKNTIHKSSNSRLLKSGSVKVASRMR
jgi:hypothetical protein